MAYVYRHIRLDKNEVFYVGIGKDDELYKRAYNSRRRSILWKNITKNIKYEVEIIFINLTWEEACQKEKEFIRLYGRIIDGSGTLTNVTTGGDGGDTTKNKICIFKEDKEKRISEEQLAYYKSLGWEKGFSKIHRLNSSFIKTGKKYSDESNKKKGRPGHKHKPETLEKIRDSHIGIKKPKVQCPKCGLVGGVAPMRRFHFENCKK